MMSLASKEFLRQTGITPLIRSTRNQLEIDFLPPYGDPEVSIPGEFATYLTLGAATVKLLDFFDE